MQLSARLRAVASMVTEGSRLVDVGCDHGYLPIFLLLNKKIPSAIAMDVRKGPLASAKENIREFGLENYIEIRLSDGLKQLEKGEGDSLTIAGMGGPLMKKILLEGEEVLEGFSELILQPQSEIGEFRRFLSGWGYKIVQEDMILEDGKFYPMMKAVPGSMEGWTEIDLKYGKFLLESKNSVLWEFLQREERLNRAILERLRESRSAHARERLIEVEEELQKLQAAKKVYEM